MNINASIVKLIEQIVGKDGKGLRSRGSGIQTHPGFVDL